MTDDVTAQRVALVPLTVNDAAEMVTVLAEDDLYAFTGGRPPTLPELRARYARQAAGHSADGTQEWRNWIIRLVTDRTAIGYVQATIVDEGTRAEIAWVVGRAWQGQGYATEAAAALVGLLDARGVGIVEAHIHPDHAASAAVASRAGLLPTGLLQDGEQLWRKEAAPL
ncbi:MAG TPA: GNAT family N-acetyltransferase [Streptosporangiaceae bacterium]